MLSGPRQTGGLGTDNFSVCGPRVVQREEAASARQSTTMISWDLYVDTSWCPVSVTYSISSRRTP